MAKTNKGKTNFFMEVCDNKKLTVIKNKNQDEL